MKKNTEKETEVAPVEQIETPKVETGKVKHFDGFEVRVSGDEITVNGKKWGITYIGTRRFIELPNGKQINLNEFE